MSQSDYAAEKSNIVEAVGARQRILENGVSVNTSDKTLEPRTAVGVSPDRKTVYLLVFDGRKTYWSSGANYDMMATIFSAFGANNATNLDGGGSSTFALLKTNAAGTSESDYNVLNKVSDGDDRKVVNGIAIVQK
jgi:exopolysaccharide biosynthesis protein